MTAFFGAVFIFIGLLDCIVLALIKLVNDTNKLASCKKTNKVYPRLVEEKIEQTKKPLDNFWDS